MKKADDVQTMRNIAEEAFELVKRYGGSHSGEHGDGIARSEFNEVMFGSEMTALFRQVNSFLTRNVCLIRVKLSTLRKWMTVPCSVLPLAIR